MWLTRKIHNTFCPDLKRKCVYFCDQWWCPLWRKKKRFPDKEMKGILCFSVCLCFFFDLVGPTGSSAQTIPTKEVEPCGLWALSCRCRDSDGDNRGMKDKTDNANAKWIYRIYPSRVLARSMWASKRSAVGHRDNVHSLITFLRLDKSSALDLTSGLSSQNWQAKCWVFHIS